MYPPPARKLSRSKPIHEGGWFPTFSWLGISQNTWLSDWFLCWVIVGVQDMFKKNMFFMRHHPPYSTFSLTQDYLGMSQFFLANGWALQNSIFCLWRASSSCFLRSHSDPQWTTIPRFPQSPLPFIPHDFCPAFNFRHVSGWNIADLTAEAAE